MHARVLSLVAVAAALVTLAMVLVGCSAISSGTITAKVHEDGHYYTVTQCRLIGKVNICTPVITYDDEDWRFDLHDGTQGGWVYVTRETYDSYDVGDYFPED